jgi:hypothetical protein
MSRNNVRRSRPAANEAVGVDGASKVRGFRLRFWAHRPKSERGASSRSNVAFTAGLGASSNKLSRRRFPGTPIS